MEALTPVHASLVADLVALINENLGALLVVKTITCPDCRGAGTVGGDGVDEVGVAVVFFELGDDLLRVGLGPAVPVGVVEQAGQPNELERGQRLAERGILHLFNYGGGR